MSGYKILLGSISKILGPGPVSRKESQMLHSLRVFREKQSHLLFQSQYSLFSLLLDFLSIQTNKQLCFHVDRISKFIDSVIILGNLDKSHRLAAKVGSVFQKDQMLFFSSNKIRFCSFGCVCMWEGWVLQVDATLKIENTCRSVTLCTNENILLSEKNTVSSQTQLSWLHMSKC